MHKSLYVAVVAMGCWTGSATKPAQPVAATPSTTGGVAYGGLLYGGLTYGGAFASLTGTGDLDSGFDDADVYGGLLGNEVGEMQGGFGVDTTSSGGGGGTGTIGTGTYGRIGHGSGAGSGYGRGASGARPVPPSVRIGQASSQGELDNNIIRRYVRRNLNKIRYCYEKELVGQPDLAGTVRAEFTIGGDGRVTSSRARGMNEPAIEQCIARVIQQIEFPSPVNHKPVVVSYPFVFSPG